MNFDHQMSLSKRSFCYSYNCFMFFSVLITSSIQFPFIFSIDTCGYSNSHSYLEAHKFWLCEKLRKCSESYMNLIFLQQKPKVLTIFSLKNKANIVNLLKWCTMVRSLIWEQIRNLLGYFLQLRSSGMWQVVI